MTKKHFKKLVSIVLTAIMVMGMSATAFASENDEANSVPATPATEDTATFSGETFYYNAETGETFEYRIY